MASTKAFSSEVEDRVQQPTLLSTNDAEGAGEGCWERPVLADTETEAAAEVSVCTS